MLTTMMSTKDFREELHSDAKHLFDYCCDKIVALELRNKYIDFLAEISVTDDCTSISYFTFFLKNYIHGLDEVILHGDIFSVSYDHDTNRHTVMYDDGYVSSELTYIAHDFDILNPDITFMDMQDSTTDKGYRVLVTRDFYTAFNFCCNCLCQTPENLKNLCNIMCIGDDHYLDIVTYPSSYHNKYGIYTSSEYHFVATLPY